MSNSLQGGIAPIPTRYKGYHFRSRLEARWAVFFDAMGIEWEYEPQGFDLSAVAAELPWLCKHGDEIGKYLPDFYLPKAKRWVEVKPDLPQNHFACLLEECKMIALLSATNCSIGYIVHGTPDSNTPVSNIEAYSDGSAMNGCIWRKPNDALRFLVTFVPHIPRSFDDAISASKSARFEHGESGRT